MTLKQETADILEKFADKERRWVFVASKGDEFGSVPFFSKIFSDHYDMKTFSAEHSSLHSKTKGYGSDYFDLTDNPTMIGTVLKKMLSTELHDHDKAVLRLTYLWENCDIDKSLNEIFGGEVITHNCSEVVKCAMECVHTDTSGERLKDPNAQALLEFIKTL